MKAAYLRPRHEKVGVRVFSRRAGRVDIGVGQLQKLSQMGLTVSPISATYQAALGREITELEGHDLKAGPIRRFTGYDLLVGYFLTAEMGWAVQGEYATTTFSMDTFKSMAEHVVGKKLYWQEVELRRLNLVTYALTDRKDADFHLYAGLGVERFVPGAPKKRGKGYILKGTIYMVLPVNTIKDGRFAFQHAHSPFTSYFTQDERYRLFEGYKKAIEKEIKFYSEVGVSLGTEGRYRSDAMGVAAGISSLAATTLSNIFKSLVQLNKMSEQRERLYVEALSLGIRDPTGRKAAEYLSGLNQADFEVFRYYVLHFEGRPVF